MEKENIMGTHPIKTLILTTALPLMGSLLISSLYNFVDSLFVSRLSEKALTAITLASPLQLIAAALGSGIAVGLNAVISKALGQKNKQKVKDTANAAIALAFLSWIVIALISLFAARPYYEWQSRGDMEIITYGVSYLSIVMLFSLGQMGQWVFDRFTIASGKTNLFLFTLSSGAITNIILDPILIFGYFGLPAMGTAGAAIATVIGQFVGAICGIILNKKYNHEIQFSFTLKQNVHAMLEILKVGIPNMITTGLVSVIGIFVTAILTTFSTTAVAAYGVCQRIQNIVLVPVWGVNNALIPIEAFNYGAQNRQRVKDSIKWSMFYELLFAVILIVPVTIFARQILEIFNASEEMMGIGIPALRILAFSWMVSVISIILGASFQGFGQSLYTMILNMGRQVIFLFLYIFILRRFGLNFIWISFVFAKLTALPVAFFLFRKTKVNFIHTIPE